jgi:phosphatidylglycerophosphatase A
VGPSPTLRGLVQVAAFGFGTGRCPVAPGTCGTLAAVPPYWLLFRDLPIAWYLSITAALFLAGIGICGATARALGVHDHPGIVWDEMVGLLVTLAGAPRGWPWVLLGVVAFRIFDVAKPWPIGLADRTVRGGLGIMLDDALAGLFGCAVVQGVAWMALGRVA